MDDGDDKNNNNTEIGTNANVNRDANSNCSTKFGLRKDVRDTIPGLVHITEILKGRLYFATVKPSIASVLKSKSNSSVHYLFVDDELIYEGFNEDFGPHSLAQLYNYCRKVNSFLKVFTGPSTKKKIVHYTTTDTKNRVNSAFLIGSYAIIYLKLDPEKVYSSLLANQGPHFIPFRDAAFGPCTYHLYLIDCLKAIKKADTLGFLDFGNFNVEEYQYYEKVENGDLNWIVPKKFLAFCGPHSKSKIENGYPIHSPESYFPYFRKYNVTTIIRLNKKLYDAKRFQDNGFDHRDLFFIDGSTPSDAIMRQFLEISENAKGAIAVHCKAGLGRTGTLIACYIIKHFRFTAADAIAWIRICRPGSIIGYQQHWLEEKEAYLWLQGDIYRATTANRKNNNITTADNDCSTDDNFNRGDNKLLHTITNDVKNIGLSETGEKVKSGNGRSRRRVKISDASATEEGETQGDQLNRIKALRRYPRSATASVTVLSNKDDTSSHQRSSSQPKGESYLSPLKSLKQQTFSVYNTRAATKKRISIDDGKNQSRDSNQGDTAGHSRKGSLKIPNDPLDHNKHPSSTKGGIAKGPPTRLPLSTQATTMASVSTRSSMITTKCVVR